jgi:hypothetical protein
MNVYDKSALRYWNIQNLTISRHADGHRANSHHEQEILNARHDVTGVKEICICIKLQTQKEEHEEYESCRYEHGGLQLVHIHLTIRDGEPQLDEERNKYLQTTYISN